MKSVRWSAAALITALVASLFVAAPAQAAPTVVKGVTLPCPLGNLGQKLAAKATKVEAEKVQGGTVARFYVPNTTQQVIDVATASAQSPSYVYGGKYWFYDAATWIQVFISDPCSGPDGYAFGWNGRCLYSTNSSTVPKTLTNCNWEANAALQYDHAAHDWDAVWGYRQYAPDNVATCADSGNYHFFEDNAPGELLTYARIKVRFLAAGNHLSQARYTTSRHFDISSSTTHAGPRTGVFAAADANPGGGFNSC